MFTAMWNVSAGRFFSLFLWTCALVWLLQPGAGQAFGFEDVAKRARDAAAGPYRQSETLPRELKQLQYDQYRDIRFKTENNLWRRSKLPFELAFFHMGLYFDQPVKINEVSADKVREIPFDPGQFDYGANKIDTAKMTGLGFAGFRVHHAVNRPEYKDEVLVFLGASYFRALGRGQTYGISARGLAVDTALGSGEEFPRFVEFWIERPAPTARSLTIYALLDSPRVAGAYRFVLLPGAETALEVKAQLFLREAVGKLGIAPLTSMFFYGENQPAGRDDYRPEVHDSDGLSLHAGNDEWIWRPLSNPRRLLITSFSTTDPRGFGLMQRDRLFAHYEDLEAHYQRRPSAWVEPKGKWGAGRVELVQIPTPDETNDNIVAAWIPERMPAPREPYDIEYRLLWQKDADARPPVGWVAQTRRGHGHKRSADGSLAFTVDFEGESLKSLGPEVELDSAVWVDSNGQLLEHVLHRNEVTGGWRLALRVRRADDKKPLEMRAILRRDGATVSETWSYILPPN